MYNILTLNKISPIGLNEFTDGYKYGDAIENPDAIMVRSAAMHDMELSDSTLAIARAGAGVNNIPVDKCAENGVVVFNTPGANANAVKELVILGLLISSRNVAGAIDWAKTLENETGVAKLVEKGKSQFAGPEIMGKTLGIIGLGAIGLLVANAAVALGMDVIGYDPFLSIKSAHALDARVKIVNDMADIFADSDYISVHVPLNDATRDTINADTIAQMKDGVRILNFARGELVNKDAIIAALESGKVASYVVDFPTDGIIGKKGVVAIPHLGASTPESEDNCAKMAAQELMAYLENGSIINSVNMPCVTLPKFTAKRICVIHKKDAAAAVTSALAGADSLVSNTRGDYGYTVADMANAPSLDGIDGVIKVRVLG